jgi:hypothetical protein
MTTKVLCWDEIGCSVNEFEVSIPDGCTPRQALILADDQIVKQIEEVGCCDDTFSKKVRQVGEVFVLDSMFGHDKETHVYWTAEGSEEDCRALALKDLAEFISDGMFGGEDD